MCCHLRYGDGDDDADDEDGDGEDDADDDDDDLCVVSYVMQLVIETAGIAHWFTILVSAID